MTTTYLHHVPRRDSLKRGLDLKRRVAEKRGTKCYWCGVETTTQSHTQNKTLPDTLRTLEHLVRKADGGKSSLDNCRIACRKCNNERHHPQKPKPASVSAAVGLLFNP